MLVLGRLFGLNGGNIAALIFVYLWNFGLKKEAVPKVMSVALIEPFDRWFLSLSKGSGTTRRNDCYTKCGGFDKLNHRNANLLDSPNSISYFYMHIQN